MFGSGLTVMRWALALLALFGLSAIVVRADSWSLPETQKYLSANGQVRFTVVPRDLNSQLEYFEDKVKGLELPDALGPTGTLERYVNGKWLTVWSSKLVNEVSPVTALVSDDGSSVVTFDNWHSVGFGDHVVVIYGNDGALIKSLRLDQIVPPYFIAGFGHSASSIWWKGEGSSLSTDGLHLVFDKPKNATRPLPQLSVKVDLSTGAVGAIEETTLAALKPEFCIAHKADVMEFNAEITFQRSDLVRPEADDKDDWAWRRYIYHAIERLKPINDPKGRDTWQEEIDFELLLPGEYMEKDFRDGFRNALSVPDHEMPRRWFFSRDQERMTREIEKIAKKIKPGQLAGTDMRFFSDSVLWLRIQNAMTPSGAMLTQIDTEKPIPPTPKTLASLPPDKQVDTSCVD